ncbi:MAG TPA: nuclear transport factor 2 family protein [Candidatus Angelobacter sp.]|nr:nuclear transport factor 2 family protein [Candidatus Angelobacter sp.]
MLSISHKPTHFLHARSFLPFAIAAAFLLGCAGPPRRATWKTATGAGEYERLMWKAIEKKEWKMMEYHLAPSFVGVTPAGKALDRTGWVEYWKGAQMQDALISELQTRPEGVDMVVTCVLQPSGNASLGGPAGGSYRVVSVWQQVKGGWTLTATSLTPVLPN